nr:MAG TPA: hypothetical protein [Caudoviricetes sp.]
MLYNSVRMCTMKRYTNKELRNLVNLGVAENLDGTDNEYRHKIEAENGYLTQIGSVVLAGF